MPISEEWKTKRFEINDRLEEIAIVLRRWKIEGKKNLSATFGAPGSSAANKFFVSLKTEDGEQLNFWVLDAGKAGHLPENSVEKRPLTREEKIAESRKYGSFDLDGMTFAEHVAFMDEHRRLREEISKEAADAFWEKMRSEREALIV